MVRELDAVRLLAKVRDGRPIASRVTFGGEFDYQRRHTRAPLTQRQVTPGRRTDSVVPREVTHPARLTPLAQTKALAAGANSMIMKKVTIAARRYFIVLLLIAPLGTVAILGSP
jgi:hypothetical protein